MNSLDQEEFDKLNNSSENVQHLSLRDLITFNLTFNL